jgi:hypothetical protein
MSRNMAAALDRIKGGAPERRPNVRSLATQAELSRCGVASLAFSLGVNADRLLEGTSMAVPFGQSQFAFARGAQFENYLTRNDCAVLFAALREDLGFSIADAEVVDLRTQFAPNLQGLRARAAKTLQIIESVLEGDPSAPNLIVGAVFETTIAEVTAYLEADAVAARDVGGTTIYTGEIKSFPIVDGRIDKEKLGKAADQVAVYQWLLRTVVQQLGGNSEVVSPEALIVTPVNMGFHPKISTMNVDARVRRAQELLATSAPVGQLASAVPSDVSFGGIADRSVSETSRLRLLNKLADGVGTHLCSSCLPNCGLVRVCRQRAHDVGDPAVAGETVVRLMPGVRTMRQARDLSAGAIAPPELEVVAESLSVARRLYERHRPVQHVPSTQTAAG